MVKLLARVRHDITDKEECAYFLKDVIIRQKKGVPFLNRLYVRIFLSKKIKLVFERYKKGELRFNESKAQLTSIIDSVR